MQKKLNIKVLRIFELMQSFKDVDSYKTAIIMFLEDLQESPEILKKYKFIHFVKINDIRSLEEINDLNEFNQKISKLCEFIHKSINEDRELWISCDCGISRSPACCAAIKEAFEQNGISIFANERYKPNKILYKAIYNELCSTSIEFANHADYWFKGGKDYSEEEKNELTKIMNILNINDPENLINIGAPDNEYLPEASTLLEVIHYDKVLSPETIYEVFKDSFYVTEMSFKKAIKIADELKEEFCLQPYD